MVIILCFLHIDHLIKSQRKLRLMYWHGIAISGLGLEVSPVTFDFLF